MSVLERVEACPLRGVSFVEGYPENLRRLHEAMHGPHPEEHPVALLIREPDNPHDANSVAVHVPAAGGLVGRIPKELAARLAPLLDDGVELVGWVAQVRVHPDHPNHGVDVGWRRRA